MSILQFAVLTSTSKRKVHHSTAPNSNYINVLDMSTAEPTQTLDSLTVDSDIPQFSSSWHEQPIF
jgi:hypothetical protein